MPKPPKTHSPSLDLVIPCYNEGPVIRETYRRIKKTISGNRLRIGQIIFINDGSGDDTLVHLSDLSASDSSVTVIDLSRNFGHQAAVTAGLHRADADVTVILDADLQDPPELIPEMIRIHLKEKAGVVYGARKSRKGESWFKKISARYFYKFINAMIERPFPENTGDFRLIDKKVLEAFKALPERGKYIRGLVSWIGFKQVPMYYDRDARFAGETKYPLRKMLRFAFQAIFYFSHKPLQLSTGFGILSLATSLGLGIYVILSLWLNPSHIAPGWASTLIVIAFFGGIQLLALAVIGEYLAILFQEIKQRPEYIVSDILSHKKNKR